MTDYTAISALIAVVGVAIGTLTVVAYVLFVWWLDRYEREPLWLVALVFLYGALGATFLAVAIAQPLSAVSHGLLGSSTGSVLDVVVWAPFVEELTKGLIFLVLILNSNFDNETDGLIYGAAVGLGFAALENLMYYMMVAPMGPDMVILVVIMRTLFSALVHCISSAILGMCIGWVRHRGGTNRWIVALFVGYALAVLNHATWNGLATAASVVGPIAPLLGIVIVILAAALMLAITQISLAREHGVIKRYLQEEARHGVLPASHAEVVPYWLRRRRKGWLPAHVPAEQYLRATTLLAFRRHQLEMAQADRRKTYERDIALLRDEVRRLLGGHAPRLALARAVLRAVPVIEVAEAAGPAETG